MSAEFLQVALALGGALAGWVARHYGLGGGSAPVPSSAPSHPAPVPAPATASPAPSVGQGQLLQWLLEQAKVDFPKFLIALAQATQPKP